MMAQVHVTSRLFAAAPDSDSKRLVPSTVLLLVPLDVRSPTGAEGMVV